MWTIRVITPPAAEPVSLAEAKAQLRLMDMVDDEHVSRLIRASRQHVERVTGRALLETVVEMRGAALPRTLRLAGGHLAATPGLSVSYLDPSGAVQVLDPSGYVVVDGGEDQGQLVLVGGALPPMATGRPDVVRVRYTVGWADGLVPDDLRMALLLLLSLLFESRQQGLNDPSVVTLNSAFDSLLNSYRFLVL